MRIGETRSAPMTDLFDSVMAGEADFGVRFMARPVVGGLFAGLVLGAGERNGEGGVGEDRERLRIEGVVDGY